MLNCNQADALFLKAETLWPDNEALQRKWLDAVGYLIQNNQWVLLGAPVTWRAAA